MPVSDTQIANAALRRLGVEKISSLTDDNKRANVLQDLYPLVRDELLEAGFWNFSMKRAQLSKLSEDPLFGWETAFQLPNDYLRMYRVEANKFKASISHLPEFFPNGFHDNVWFSIEGDRLLADISDCFCIYSAHVTDASKFSSGFVKAFYLKLAAEAAYSITQDKTLANALTEEANVWLQEVRSRDAQSDNDPNDEISMDAFVAPRFY